VTLGFLSYSKQFLPRISTTNTAVVLNVIPWYIYRYASTFRRNMLPPSSGYQLFQTLVRITKPHGERARIQ